MAMTINCINEMNLYFHMQNHYRKLRSAKSRLCNTSKGSSNLPSSRSEKSARLYSCNERHENICPILQHKQRRTLSCDTKSEPCISQRPAGKKLLTTKNSGNLQFMKRDKKKSKKKENDDKPVERNIISTDNISKEEETTSVKNEQEFTNSLKVDSMEENQGNICMTDKETLIYSRAEEQEYLQFLLRITEDIIINNYSNPEDIKKVFDHHIEINVERLRMDKMFIQISALCSALNISDEKYKSSDLVMEKSTFEPLYDCNISSDINLLKDCECSVKRFLGTTENKLKLDSDAEINFINFEDTFISQKFCKYVKTTEAVEHVGKLDEHSSYKSETEIPHSHTVEVLPRPEIFENDYQDKEINPHKGDDVFVQDSALNENDSKIIDFGNNLEYKEQGIDNTVTKNLNNQNVQNQQCDKKLKRELTFVKSPSAIDEKAQNNKIIEQLQSNKKLLEQMFFILQKDVNMVNQSTQIFIEYKDEECNTTLENVNQGYKDADYVLINGPVYVLNDALSPEKRIVLSEKKHIDIDLAPVKEITSETEKNCSHVEQHQLNLSDYSVLTQTNLNSKYESNIDFSRLLQSDYDLTPEKDESSSKYNYLMVDGYTTISSPNVQSNGERLTSTENYLNLNMSSTKINQTVSDNSLFSDNLNRELIHEDTTASNSLVEGSSENLLTKTEAYLLQPLLHSSVNDEIKPETKLFSKTEQSENDHQFDYRSRSDAKYINKYRIKGNHERITSEESSTIESIEVYKK